MEILQTTQTAPDCLWMQAGVVRKKLCFSDFSCTTCRFDRALSHACRENEQMREQGKVRAGKKGQLVFWKDRMAKMPLAKRPCVHSMKGRISFKACPKSYHCVDCEFDQYFHDQFKVHTIMKPVGFEDIGGVSLPAGFYLHPGHTWLKIEDGNRGRVGIDDFSSRLLGKFDRMAAPLMGKELKQGHTALTLFREDNAVSFLAPVNGTITDVNEQVRKNPGLIQDAPYTDGWIFVVHCPNLKQDLKQLLFMEDNTRFMETEVGRLFEFLEETTQLKAADGGTLVNDIYGNLPGVDWNQLTERFIPGKS